MKRRGMPEAWAAYRADWSGGARVLAKPRLRREAADDQLPRGCFAAARTSGELPEDRVIEPLGREEARPSSRRLAPRLFSGIEPRSLEAFFWENPPYDFSESLFALKERRSGKVLGAGLLVISDTFADPTKIDAAMPCFRLGAFGTERERHKRVNGLFSCVFADQAEGELLLSAPDWERARRAGLTHVAAQAPSDAIALCAFYDRIFQRQGAFPILSRLLSG